MMPEGGVEKRLLDASSFILPPTNMRKKVRDNAKRFRPKPRNLECVMSMSRSKAPERDGNPPSEPCRQMAWR